MFCRTRQGQQECCQGARTNSDGLETLSQTVQPAGSDLQFLCPPAGSSLRDLLQLFDSLTEICHPLDHSHGGRDSVSAPATREDAWEEEDALKNINTK